MSFQPINLKSIIHCMKYTIMSFDFKFHNLTTRFKVSHKIHTFKTKGLQNPKLIHHILIFIHVSSMEHNSTKTRQNIYHFSTYYMSFQKHIGITITIFNSFYTLLYHHQYNHYRLNPKINHPIRYHKILTHGHEHQFNTITIILSESRPIQY